MEISDNISPTIALVGILSGIFLFALSLLVFHILLQRRKARARAMRFGGGGAATLVHNHHHKQQRQAFSWSSIFFSFSSSSRRHRLRPRSRSDSEAEDLASGSVGGENLKEKSHASGPRVSSLYLEPNQPLHVEVDVDVESESDERGPHPGMQFILTPPTPVR